MIINRNNVADTTYKKYWDIVNIYDFQSPILLNKKFLKA